MKLKYTNLLLALGLAFAAHSASAVEKMRLGHGLAENHPVHVAMAKFAELVKGRSNGELDITVYPNGVLGGEREMLEQLQNNVLEFTKASAAPLETFSRSYKIFNLPFVFRDQNHYMNVLEGSIGEEILLSSAKSGFIGLTFYDSGARSFYGKKAINTPDDLKGMKVRVQESPTTIKMMKALGATPTPMAYGEVYSALQAGVVDMAESNVTVLTVGRHGEVCKFFSYTEQQRLPDVLVVSKSRWDKFTKPQQEIIKKAAMDSFALQKDLWTKTETEEKEKAIKMGVQFNTPDKAPFVAKVKSMMADERKNAQVAKLLDQIEATK